MERFQQQQKKKRIENAYEQQERDFHEMICMKPLKRLHKRSKDMMNNELIKRTAHVNVAESLKRDWTWQNVV